MSYSKRVKICGIWMTALYLTNDTEEKAEVEAATDGSISDDERKSIEEYVIAAGNAKAMEIIETQTGNEAGPCLTVVYDPLLHKLYYGQNYKKNATQLEAYEKWINKEADPIIRERMQKYQKDIDTGVVIEFPETHDPRLGAHSEVRALDEALKERRALGLEVNEETISEMYVYNIDLRKLMKGKGIVPKDRCENCSRITDGVKTIGHN